MACICKDGWTNTNCREHGVSDGSREPYDSDDRRRDNDR